jgi:hypothetical protein
MQAGKRPTTPTSKDPVQLMCRVADASMHAQLTSYVRTLNVRRKANATQTRTQHGPYSKEELAALDCAIKEYAQKHGLSTTSFE